MKIHCKICNEEMEVDETYINCHNKCYLDKYKKDFPDKYAQLIKEYPSFEKDFLNTKREIGGTRK